MTIAPGKIIFLHGPSSSGKSTLARAIQARIDEPFWHISIDHLRDSGVLPSARFKNGEFDWKAKRQEFFDGFHQSLAAYAGAGNNLILEHILEGPGWFEELAELFAPFDVFFVGLHCDLAELNRREAKRGDRKIGSAEEDFHKIHKGLRYDLEIRTDDDEEGNAARVINAWKARKAPSVFAGAAAESADLSAIYRNYIACLNAQNWDDLGRFVAEDARHNGRPFGLSGYRKMLEKDFDDIPDLHFNIRTLVCEPPHIAAILHFDCSPRATFLGLPVNGKKVAFTENVFYEFRNGRIVDVRSIVDKAAIEAQL